MEAFLIYLKCEGCIQQQNAMTNHDKEPKELSPETFVESRAAAIPGRTVFSCIVPDTGQGNYIPDRFRKSK